MLDDYQSSSQNGKPRPNWKKKIAASDVKN
jgi:hypothetical protein